MLLGRAGSDPQTKGTEDHPVVTFSIATNTKIKSSGEEAARVSTDWHRVCCFQPKLREMTTKYLQRGSRVLVTGKIAYGQIVDGQGSVHQTTSIVAGNICLFMNIFKFESWLLDNIIFLTNARQSEEPDVDEEGIPETEVFQHQKSSIMEWDRENWAQIRDAIVWIVERVWVFLLKKP